MDDMSETQGHLDFLCGEPNSHDQGDGAIRATRTPTMR